jgi:hypothetical protein
MTSLSLLTAKLCPNFRERFKVQDITRTALQSIALPVAQLAGFAAKVRTATKDARSA